MVKRDDAAPLRAPLADLMDDTSFARDLRALAADAHDAAEYEAVVGRTGKALVSLEDHISRAETLKDSLRRALLAVMVEAGDPGFSTGTHTIGYAERRPTHIIDAAAIPASFMKTPPPSPDMVAVAKALKAGGDVPGVVLGNPVPSLFIRRSKQ